MALRTLRQQEQQLSSLSPPLHQEYVTARTKIAARQTDIWLFTQPQTLLLSECPPLDATFQRAPFSYANYKLSQIILLPGPIALH